MTKIKTAVIGATGYTGGELLRILVHHPAVELVCVHSNSQKGKKVTDPNPWKANSLEWTTPIKTGHGNWEGDIPEVHRWAYDYGKDGQEFIQQTTPVSADESKH